MNSTSVNMHFHGTNTSPVCGQDEVIKTIINSGRRFSTTCNSCQRAAGLYWYHPHITPAEAAVLGGGSGASWWTHKQCAARRCRLPQQILVIRDQQQIQNLGEGPADAPTTFLTRTLRKQCADRFKSSKAEWPVTFTPAVLSVNPHEKQFWRVTNSSADTILDLQVQYKE